MPTPVGHAIGGLATAWFSDSIVGQRRSMAFAIACIAASIVPDVDIVFRSHRTYTHSAGAMLIAGSVAWLLARRRYRRPVGLACTVGAAYGTHVLLDWLARDTAPPFGLMALWPFSTRFYLSGANLFLEVSRRYWKPDEFLIGNLKAVGWEILLLAPVAGLAYLARQSRVKSQ